MIVTRKRRKPFKLQKYLLPILIVAIIVFAFIWTPSHNAIFNGPLAPMWNALGSTYNRAAAPYHFAQQNSAIAERDRQIQKLQQQIAADRAEADALNKQLSQSRTSLNQTQQQQALDRAKVGSKAPAPQRSTSGLGAQAAAGSDLSSAATPDLRRTASEWESMDAENAAKVVQRLPISYVARVFAVMPADSVGQILNNLPPAFAAQLTQEHPELRR
ncbi:MAG: hypothetical protein M3Y21_01890 [Candidatus Eremiobacteraeota bacterium]|nr:hypothetical protein [Candidatus Eremiobacteraeota bacterium]